MTALTAGQAAASLAPAAIPVATPNSVRQWWTLSTRAIRAVVVNGEIIMAFVSPAFLAVCFYLPLRNIMNIPGMNYAQFLMPIIVLQSVAFTATSAAMRVSRLVRRRIIGGSSSARGAVTVGSPPSGTSPPAVDLSPGTARRDHAAGSAKPGVHSPSPRRVKPRLTASPPPAR